MALENAKDIIAIGCDSDTTFLYPNFQYMSPPLWFNVRRASLVCSTLKALFIIASYADSTQQISLRTAWAYFGSYDDEINTGTVILPKPSP